MGAAIEVLHAPLGFPNQEIWLWEPGRELHDRVSRLGDGHVVGFQILWRVGNNHWEVVDVGQ